MRDQNLTCPLKKKVEQLSYLYKLHTCVDPDVVLVICRTGKSPPAALLITDIGSLPGVCTDMYFPDIGGGERPLASFKGALKGALTWNVPEEIAKHYIFLPDNTFTSIKPSNIDQTNLLSNLAYFMNNNILSLYFVCFETYMYVQKKSTSIKPHF